ncbi:GGDEF domain-containing protein [Blastococcus sp. SYSU DS0510]
MTGPSPERIAGRSRLVAALVLLPPAVDLVLRAVAPGRGCRLRQQEAPLRRCLPAGVAVLSLLVQLRHDRDTQRLVDELAQRSRTDALTGLGNRWAFDEELAARLEGSHGPRRHRADPTSTTVLLVDVDHFKAYNDRHGHPAGDAALVQVARAIRRGARRGDGVHRIGGEEFAVLLEAGHEEGLRVADRVRRAVAEAGGGQITVSVGVATGRGEEPGSLFARADRALYRAKDRGRNCVDSHHAAAVAEVDRSCPALR